MQNIQPPWPQPVAYISGAIILVGALVARELASEATKRTRVRLLFVAAALTVIGLFAYLYLYLQVVVQLDGDERRTLGFTCTQEAQRLYENCPHLTARELAEGEYDPANFFTPGSLITAKLLLVAAWLLFTAGLVAAVGWAVAARGEDDAPPVPAKPAPRPRKPRPKRPAS